MLTDLDNLQESDENVQAIELSFDIETRSDDSGECIERRYTFSYAEEWDKWVFTEFKEKRTPDEGRIADRNWRKSRHVMWHDGEAPNVDVPPEVSQKLKDATGAEKVTIQ
jgi:hypothetical protein